MNFVVLSSSRGTVLEATLKSIKDGTLHAECLGLVSDSLSHACIEVAKKYNLPFKVIERQRVEDRTMYDKRVQEAVLSLGSPDFIACMGWMRILSAWFVRQWPNKILNVHPSLLPKHKGMHAHALVLQSGETESGMTIHFIDEGLDTGKILVQKKCSVMKDDTEDTLRARVQELEKEWYPKTLEMIQQGELKL